MRIVFSALFIVVLFQGCGYRLVVPESRVVFEQQGYLVFNYENRWYFIPTDPCAPLGKARIGAGFPINNIIGLSSIYESGVLIPAFVPGTQHKEEMMIRLAPVSIRYCYQRRAEQGDETLSLKEGTVLFKYRHLRDLTVIEVNVVKCGSSN